MQRMARAITHRGPDEEGFLEQPGISLASRRLSIVDLADGQQPMTNEDRSVFVVFNGELFDYVERREELVRQGHRFRTHCDTEIIPHLWEDHHEGIWERLRGQFAIALWDARLRQLHLGRDRFGIAPLFWSRQGDWLLFASEIKGLLASGMVPPRPDRKGLDHVFTFSAVPGPRTCFEGVQLLPPGYCLRIVPGSSGKSPVIAERAYWEMDFPVQGEEEWGNNPNALVDEFERLLLQAVEERLRADVPVGSYLSGGVDSSMILALACRLKGPAINTYTVRVDEPEFDELSAASLSARHIGAKPPIVQDYGDQEALESYPQLIEAAEAPVIDTACGALLKLAERVHANGQKVVLTGEGSDETLAGYTRYAFTIRNASGCVRLGQVTKHQAARRHAQHQNPHHRHQGLEGAARRGGRTAPPLEQEREQDGRHRPGVHRVDPIGSGADPGEEQDAADQERDEAGALAGR